MAWYLKYLHPIQTNLATSPHFPPTAHHVLQDTLDAINEARVTKQLQDRIAELIELAHGMMSSAPSQAALHQWRRVHTDASITRAVFFLDGTTYLDAIPSLDTAIIISGAAGNDRLNLIQSLIKDIQIRYAPAQPFTSQLNHPERDDIVNDHLESAAHKVPQLESPPSILTFQTNFFREPFVLRGYARGWPAMQERPWHSASYLRSIAGVGRVVPVEVGSDYRSDDWSQKIVPWDEFLSALDFADQPRSSTADVMYLAQHNLFMQFPSLWSDIIIPDYVYADLNCSDHTPPQNDEKLVINVWLGPRGTVSPAHTDPYHNMYVQLVGSKTVWLAPPETSPWMYPCTGSAFAHPAVNDLDPQMSNTTRVDVFEERTSVSEVKHPEFWKEVTPRALSYTLVAGDLLYIPAGWWHGMRSEDTSFSVSMWF